VGVHDDSPITSQMPVVDPTTVRMKQRVAADKFPINGVEPAPADKSIAWTRRSSTIAAGECWCPV
jgi:hypothetical protein